MSAAPSVIELTVEDVAVLLGASKDTARRFMVRLEDEHGESVVYRRGSGSKPRLFTTSAAIAPFVPHPAPLKTALELEVERLRSGHMALIRRHDALAAEVYELKRKSNEWFRRKH